MEFRCAHCGTLADRPAGHVNRARRLGLNVYCSKECSFVGRRSEETTTEKKAEKRLYDIDYRRKNRALLKAKKAAYHKRTYDPLSAAVHRKKRMPYHVEYCRRPEYREWKKQYDRRYRAEKEYGDLAECFLLVMDIRDECLSQMSDYEIRLSKDGVAKAQRRKRDYARLDRKEPEIGPLGNLELGQGRQDGAGTR